MKDLKTTRRVALGVVAAAGVAFAAAPATAGSHGGVDFSGKTIEFAENCTPGYYNGEGDVSPTARQDGFYFGDDPHEFIRILEAWRESGDLPGMVRV